MKALIFLTIATLFTTLTGCKQEKYKTVKHTDSNGFSYETVTNDPYNLRIYTLKNGLKIYLSVNKDEPRIQTYIPVKAGSTYDPPETTGLAHYLEHMMFKGTSKLGTVNWGKEKPLIDEISNLFEQHRKESDPIKKKIIYHKIDSVSQLAAQYIAPNEYDRAMTSIGASGTNAYTTNERTVFINNIPSNELEKWLQLESERMYDLVLRAFHTELETVYEEFNMGQDRDGRKAYYKMLDLLFPVHPYGQQTTIGKAEHLKNPSMVNIMNYWSKYYVPNNMAICLSGDLDPEKTISLIDKYFGKIPEKPVEPVVLPKEKPIDTIRSANIYGPENEFVYMAYRFDGGVDSKDEMMVNLIDYMLNNSKAGLIDLDLNQKQKVLGAGCSPNFMKEYGMHLFYGYPRQGQTLEQVRDLLLAEIDKIKNGDFDDWLIQASINNLKLEEMKNIESNSRAHTFATAFANNVPWKDIISEYDNMESITKEQIMQFAKEKYDNYVIVYKRMGEDTTVVKVDKPEITPINLNRNNESEYFKQWTSEKSEPIKPVFADFKNSIKTIDFDKNIKFSYIKNSSNSIFKLNYIIEIGKDNDKELALAVGYLPYMGTDKYTPAELQQEFFKYGLSFGVSTSAKRSKIYITGLEENADKGVELLEHLLHNVVADSISYAEYIKGIEKKRLNRKTNKNEILFGGLLNYGIYGKESPYRDILSQKEMENIDPNILADKIKSITKKDHNIFYYGQNSEQEALSLVKKYHKIPEQLEQIPNSKVYNQQPIDKPVVYFVDFDMVQTQMLILSKDTKLDISLIPNARLFNEFYGSGLSSIVFQEIREARALAYSAFSHFSTPSSPEKSHYDYSFIATQPDKVKEATDAMISLLNNIPDAGTQFELSKESIMKNIETKRIIKDNIYWQYLKAKDMGIDYDIRKDVYDYMKVATMNDFKKFFDEHISNKQYIYMVIGNKDMVDFNVLKKLGPVKELSLEEIFNY